MQEINSVKEFDYDGYRVKLELILLKEDNKNESNNIPENQLNSIILKKEISFSSSIKNRQTLDYLSLRKKNKYHKKEFMDDIMFVKKTN